MVELYEAVDVGNEMILHILDLDVGNLGPNVVNGGVGDDDIEMIDAVGCKLLYSVGGVGGDGGVDLDDEKRSAVRLGRIDECFGSGVVGVAVGGNYCVV